MTDKTLIPKRNRFLKLRAKDKNLNRKMRKEYEQITNIRTNPNGLKYKIPSREIKIKIKMNCRFYPTDSWQGSICGK